MNFKTWMEQAAIRELCHGTSEPIETLLQQGLKVGNTGAGSPAVVYLTDNLALALQYANSDQERTDNNTICVITIDVSKLDPNKLGPDLDAGEWDDEGAIETWLDSLRAFNQCAYHDNIPPAAFSNHHSWPIA